jgi:Leucine-rich repeat (LRR) protein
MKDSGSANAAIRSLPQHERARDVDTDLPGLDPWRPLHEACVCLSMQKPKTDLELRRISELWNGRRDVELQLWGHAVQDFEFLRYFPGLERFNVQVPIIRNIEGLRHVAESLKEFTLASTTVRLSLQPVAACARLESLHLQRQVKDFGALRSLTRLRYLGISGNSLPDLSALLPFEALQSLFLGFCKPIDLGLLGRFTELEALHIIKMNNLRELSALRLGRNLKRIELEWLPHVETVPDLSGLTKLEEVEITTMKSLRDVSSIATAPALRFLGLWDCKSLTPQRFECLLGHPTLKRLNFGAGRLKDNEVIAAMFPEEMTRTVYYTITPGTNLRRPTP